MAKKSAGVVEVERLERQRLVHDVEFPDAASVGICGDGVALTLQDGEKCWNFVISADAAEAIAAGLTANAAKARAAAGGRH